MWHCITAILAHYTVVKSFHFPLAFKASCVADSFHHILSSHFQTSQSEYTYISACFISFFLVGMRKEIYSLRTSLRIIK